MLLKQVSLIYHTWFALQLYLRCCELAYLNIKLSWKRSSRRTFNATNRFPKHTTRLELFYGKTPERYTVARGWPSPVFLWDTLMRTKPRESQLRLGAQDPKLLWKHLSEEVKWDESHMWWVTLGFICLTNTVPSSRWPQSLLHLCCPTIAPWWASLQLHIPAVPYSWWTRLLPDSMAEKQLCYVYCLN